MGKNNAGESPETGTPLDCEQWEALLADKMDSTMAPETEAAFAEHSLHCPGCGELLEQARQGQQWLKLLEEHAPSAPVDLLSRILAKTQGAGREMDFVAGATAVLPGQAPAGRWGLPFLPAAGAGLAAARGVQNARMLMTAGMAFFSVALTLSVAGVRLTQVHAAELRPQVVQANVSRSFYGTKKQVVSFYENLRLVYEVESKMHDMRRETDQAPAQHPTQSAPKAKTPGHASAGDGLDRQGGSGGPNSPAPHASDGDSKHPRQAEQVAYGWPVFVSYLPLTDSACKRHGTSPCTTERLESPGAICTERNRI